MKKIKKVFSSTVAMVVVCCSVFLTFGQVSASNTNLTTWAVAAYVGESRFGSDGRKKDDSTPLRVKYTSGSYSIDVGAFGSSSQDGTYIDLTYPDYSMLSWKHFNVGNNKKVSSYVYETFGSQAYARIKICVGGTGSYMGSWSPDSTN